MQQELIEMLEEIIPYVEVWKSQDQEVIDKAEALIKKAKNTTTAMPQGWRFKRNEDGSIGIFAPPPKPGESQRTSHAVYLSQNWDLHDLLGKLADQQAATSAPAPAQEQCNACLGTGRMVRDPDIGTDQECFVCDGSGYEPAQEVGLTDEMIAAGGRALCDISADACNVDRDDNWALYSEVYKSDAHACIIAALSAKENKL